MNGGTPGSTKWVAKSGLPALVWIPLAGTVLVAVLATAALIVIGSRGPAIAQVEFVSILIPGVILGCMAGALFWSRVPRRVGLSDSGVTIVYPLRTVSLAWDELMDVVGIGLGELTFWPRSPRPKGLSGWFAVTLAQAEAILTDPRCPQVDLPPGARSMFTTKPSPPQS